MAPSVRTSGQMRGTRTATPELCGDARGVLAPQLVDGRAGAVRRRPDVRGRAASRRARCRAPRSARESRRARDARRSRATRRSRSGRGPGARAFNARDVDRTDARARPSGSGPRRPRCRPPRASRAPRGARCRAAARRRAAASGARGSPRRAPACAAGARNTSTRSGGSASVGEARHGALAEHARELRRDRQDAIALLLQVARHAEGVVALAGLDAEHRDRLHACEQCARARRRRASHRARRSLLAAKVRGGYRPPPCDGGARRAGSLRGAPRGVRSLRGAVRGSGARHARHYARERPHRPHARGSHHAGGVVPDLGARRLGRRGALHRSRASLRAHDVPRLEAPRKGRAPAPDRGARRADQRVHHARRDGLLHRRDARAPAARGRARGRASREPRRLRGESRGRAPGGDRGAALSHRERSAGAAVRGAAGAHLPGASVPRADDRLEERPREDGRGRVPRVLRRVLRREQPGRVGGGRLRDRGAARARACASSADCAAPTTSSAIPPRSRRSSASAAPSCTSRSQGPIVAMAWHAPATGHADAEALDVASEILSSGRTSRLYRALVYDEPIALGAAGGYWELAARGSVLRLGAGAAGRERGHARRRCSLREIERLRNEPPSAAELSKAKRALEVGLIAGQGSSHALAARIAEDWIAFGRIRPLDERLAAIRAVTAADVQRVAKTWLVPDGRSVVQLLRSARREGAAVSGRIYRPALAGALARARLRGVAPVLEAGVGAPAAAAARRARRPGRAPPPRAARERCARAGARGPASPGLRARRGDGARRGRRGARRGGRRELHRGADGARCGDAHRARARGRGGRARREPRGERGLGRDDRPGAGPLARITTCSSTCWPTWCCARASTPTRRRACSERAARGAPPGRGRPGHARSAGTSRGRCTPGTATASRRPARPRRSRSSTPPTARAFHRRVFTPGSAIVFASGDVDAAALLARIRSHVRRLAGSAAGGSRSPAARAAARAASWWWTGPISGRRRSRSATGASRAPIRAGSRRSS